MAYLHLSFPVVKQGERKSGKEGMDSEQTKTDMTSEFGLNQKNIKVHSVSTRII